MCKSLCDLLLTGTFQESDIITMLTGVIVGAIGILADLIITQGKQNRDLRR